MKNAKIDIIRSSLITLGQVFDLIIEAVGPLYKYADAPVFTGGYGYQVVQKEDTIWIAGWTSSQFINNWATQSLELSDFEQKTLALDKQAEMFSFYTNDNSKTFYYSLIKAQQKIAMLYGEAGGDGFTRLGTWVSDYENTLFDTQKTNVEDAESPEEVHYYHPEFKEFMPYYVFGENIINHMLETEFHTSIWNIDQIFQAPLYLSTQDLENWKNDPRYKPA